MPSLFDKKPEGATEKSAPSGPSPVKITDSELYCEYCLGLTTEALYSEYSETLVWDCVSCAKRNVVRGIRIE